MPACLPGWHAAVVVYGAFGRTGKCRRSRRTNLAKREPRVSFCRSPWQNGIAERWVGSSPLPRNALVPSQPGMAAFVQWLRSRPNHTPTEEVEHRRALSSEQIRVVEDLRELVGLRVSSFWHARSSALVPAGQRRHGDLRRSTPLSAMRPE